MVCAHFGFPSPHSKCCTKRESGAPTGITQQKKGLKRGVDKKHMNEWATKAFSTNFLQGGQQQPRILAPHHPAVSERCSPGSSARICSAATWSPWATTSGWMAWPRPRTTGSFRRRGPREPEECRGMASPPRVDLNGRGSKNRYQNGLPW